MEFRNFPYPGDPSQDIPNSTELCKNASFCREDRSHLLYARAEGSETRAGLQLGITCANLLVQELPLSEVLTPRLMIGKH